MSEFIASDEKKYYDYFIITVEFYHHRSEIMMRNLIR